MLLSMKSVYATFLYLLSNMHFPSCVERVQSFDYLRLSSDSIKYINTVSAEQAFKLKFREKFRSSEFVVSST
jgi:hypothetical protein